MPLCQDFNGVFTVKANFFQDICSTVYGDRPPILLQAMGVAYAHPHLASMSVGTRSVLLSLIARLSRYKPWDTFRARVDLCAEEVGVSRKTVTRSLNRFIAAGWLYEDGGGRTPSGRFGAFGYRFSTDLLEMIGLSQAAFTNRATGVSHGFLYIDVHSKEDHLETTCANALEDQSQNQQPPSATTGPRLEGTTALQIVTPAETDSDAANPQLEARTDINPLPTDVSDLNTLFLIHPLQVYRLMGLATKAGHRLADLLVIAKDYLTKISATGFRAIRYIESMLRKGTGYKKRSQEKTATAAEQRTKTQLERDEAEFSGRVFVSRRGGRVDVRKGFALVTTPDGKGASISGTGMLKVYDDIRLGILVAV